MWFQIKNILEDSFDLVIFKYDKVSVYCELNEPNMM